VLGSEPIIRENYVKTGRLRIVFAPVLNHGDYSDQTHQAAECAADQGRFWDFHNLLFENQDAIWFSSDMRATIKELAAQTGLDTAQFNTCLDEQRHFELIRAQDQIRQNLGIRGQPVFSINGDYFVGSQPYEVLQAAIESKLSE
jgi:protein-disulfide isomerase